jgi:hypothetical protein
MTLKTATRAEPETEPPIKRRNNKRRATQVQDTPVDRIFMVGVYVLLTTFLLIVLVPRPCRVGGCSCGRWTSALWGMKRCCPTRRS